MFFQNFFHTMIVAMFDSPKAPYVQLSPQSQNNHTLPPFDDDDDYY